MSQNYNTFRCNIVFLNSFSDIQTSQMVKPKTRQTFRTFLKFFQSFSLERFQYLVTAPTPHPLMAGAITNDNTYLVSVCCVSSSNKRILVDRPRIINGIEETKKKKPLTWLRLYQISRKSTEHAMQKLLMNKTVDTKDTCLCCVFDSI